MPKLVYQEIMQGSKLLSSTIGRGVSRELFKRHFNIYSPENVFHSIFSEGNKSNTTFVKSGTYGFAHLMGLSPQEVMFSASGSFMEQVLFSMVKWEQKFMNDVVDFVMETIDQDPQYSCLERGKVRAVTRMLLVPTKSEMEIFHRKFATGPSHAPFEALVVPYQDRIISNARIIHSAYTYIPRARAPPVCYVSFPSNLLARFFQMIII